MSSHGLYLKVLFRALLFKSLLLVPLASIAADVKVKCYLKERFDSETSVSRAWLKFNRDKLGPVQAKFVVTSNSKAIVLSGVGTVKEALLGGSKVWTVWLDVQNDAFKAVGIDLEAGYARSLGTAGVMDHVGKIVGSTILECEMK